MADRWVLLCIDLDCPHTYEECFERVDENMTDEEIMNLATKVHNLMTINTVTSLIPTDIGAWIREINKTYPFSQTSVLYARNAHAVILKSEMRPDGSILLDMQDENGITFWSVLLRPVDLALKEIRNEGEKL